MQHVLDFLILHFTFFGFIIGATLNEFSAKVFVDFNIYEDSNLTLEKVSH